MHGLYSLATCIALFSIRSVVAHVGNDHEVGSQIPIGYVKYPYQATYPGDNEGESLLRTVDTQYVANQGPRWQLPLTLYSPE